MTSNPFHSDNLAPNWAEANAILKGDLPGHDFHGNQYQQGGGGGGPHPSGSHQSERAWHRGMANLQTAEGQKQAAKDMIDGAPSAKTDYHFAMANLHEEAAQAHQDAIDNPSPEAEKIAQEATERADNPDGYTVAAPNASGGNTVIAQVSRDRIYY